MVKENRARNLFKENPEMSLEIIKLVIGMEGCFSVLSFVGVNEKWHGALFFISWSERGVETISFLWAFISTRFVRMALRKERGK